MNQKIMQKVSYGLFVLTAREGEKDNGCIINTVSQVASEPNTIAISVNKNNYTHDMIVDTGEFNVSILSESAKFDTFKHFGFQSGKNVDKFASIGITRANNGIAVIQTKETNGYISGKVFQEIDLGSHTLFIASVIDGEAFSDTPSATYSFYFSNIKPKIMEQKKWLRDGFVQYVDIFMRERLYLMTIFAQCVSTLRPILYLCKHSIIKKETTYARKENC